MSANTDDHIYSTVIFENIVQKYPVLDARAYSTLALAVSAMGTNPATILIPEPLTVTEDLTIPATVTLDILQGGIITVSAGKTLTINGTVKAGDMWRQTERYSFSVTVHTRRMTQIHRGHGRRAIHWKSHLSML